MGNTHPSSQKPTIDVDETDDGVGPPEPAEGSVTTKKGVSRFSFANTLRFYFPVLPHERVYLEHLPNADQYYKSFMHETLSISVL
jgi:peptidylprolyl isomerase domain and WD repeat-containing protein 1